MNRALILAPLLPLALAACADSVSGVYHTPGQRAGEVVGASFTFKNGYSMAPELNAGSARRMAHERVEALPDGATVTLGENGSLYALDPMMVEIIRRKRLVIVQTPESEKIIMPKPFKRVQP